MNRTAILSPWVCQGCGVCLQADPRRSIIAGVGMVIGVAVHLVAMRRGTVGLDVFGGVLAIGGLLGVLGRERVRVISEGPMCRRCGYDLTNLPTGALCPECGSPP